MNIVMSEENFENSDYGFVYEQPALTENISKPIEKKNHNTILNLSFIIVHDK